MLTHYLSRAMRNSQPCIALCGVVMTAEQMDWSLWPPGPLPLTFHPSLVSCQECQDHISQIVPRNYWDQRVEINMTGFGPGRYTYAAFYPDHMVYNDAGKERIFVNPSETAHLPYDVVVNHEPKYLSFQNIYDTQKILAQSAPNPWMQPIKYLRPGTPNIIAEAISCLERTAVREAEVNGEKDAADIALAAQELATILPELDCASFPNSGGFVLNPRRSLP